MIEVWKSIQGYEGCYEISNTGVVRSLKFPNGKTRLEPKIIKTFDNGHGYEKVNLCNRGTMQKLYVHRLVAIHFLDSDPDRDVINHKDFNRKNNCADNLEWVTTHENIAYSIGHNRKCLKNHKLARTGEKYIYNNGSKFSVYITQIKFYKHAESLDEAIKLRYSGLKKLNKHYASI